MGGEDLIVLARLYAIAEANRIFGFDGWDRETVECLQAREAGGTSQRSIQRGYASRSEL